MYACIMLIRKKMKQNYGTKQLQKVKGFDLRVEVGWVPQVNKLNGFLEVRRQL